jgi:putative hydrolase of the HAD superfamily
METLFDDIFYSARLGVLKPNALFFERIAAALGPQAEPPLLFDDSSSVVEAARDFGWEAVLYDQLTDCTSHPWIARTLEAAT